MGNEVVIKRLEVLEAQSRQMAQDCRNTIRLIKAEDVSTSSQDQKALSDRELAEVARKYRARRQKQSKL